jgi:hypothetical protein
MPVRWRILLAAIIAAAIVGGFMPHGVLSAAQSSATEMVQVAEAPLAALPNCDDVTCGKGSPAPPAPAPTVALVSMVGGLAVVAVAAARLRRHRSQAVPLPAGNEDRLLRPPQFS